MARRRGREGLAVAHCSELLALQARDHPPADLPAEQVMEAGAAVDQ